MGGQRKTYSRERRRKIGEGVSRKYRETLEAEGASLPEKKRCSKCGGFKGAENFVVRRRKLKSGIVSETLRAKCNECNALNQKERIRRLAAEGVDVRRIKREQDNQWRKNLSPQRLAALREYQREHQAIYRRRKGGSAAKSKGQHNHEGERLSPEPIVGLLWQELDDKRGRQTPSNGIGLLAEHSGIAQRRIYGLLRGEYEQVALSTVDKLLHGMGLPHMLPILYPEES